MHIAGKVFPGTLGRGYTDLSKGGIRNILGTLTEQAGKAGRFLIWFDLQPTVWMEMGSFEL